MEREEGTFFSLPSTFQPKYRAAFLFFWFFAKFQQKGQLKI
jgi:hypothetical protein